MAILETPKWETITPEMHDLFTWIGKQDFTNRFYLAGGTAIALQLGDRHSVDLDFFAENDEIHSRTREELVRVFSRRKSQIIENTDGNLLLLVDNIHVGFFSYGYHLLEPFLSIENVNLASLLDIGLMKLDAIVGRGARKDFYDLYFIARKFPLKKLLLSGKRKYPQVRDFALMALEALLLFDNADRDLQPEMLMEIPWNTVKKFFIEQGTQLGEKWFG